MVRRVFAIVLACLLTAVTFFEISQRATAHTDKIITVTFINNDQFIIEDGAGPVIYTDVIQEPVAADPDPDIILITHDHFDHFDPILVEQMANTYGSIVVGPNLVIDALEGSVPPGQLVRMDPILYERMNLTVRGINIKAYHGSCDNNSYRFTLGGGVVSIYHSGDNIQGDFEQYISNNYTELYNLDIAMIANWFDLSSFNSSYHPNVMIEMHFGDHCEVYENYPANITLYSEESWQYNYIPTVNVKDGTTPLIDGTASPGEWDDAGSIRFYNGQGEINVYFKHNSTTLFFMSHIEDSTYYDGDDIVIGIDTGHDAGIQPQPDDYQFYIRRDVSISEINRGTGSGWERVPDEEWAGLVCNETFSNTNNWTMEISIAYNFLGITQPYQAMGIEFRSYDDNPEGWFNWPQDSSEDNPSTWADVSSLDNWGIEYEAKTLYIGGSGSGNYTHIQWAIENASDGDTVFVYDDSSPYYENVVVDRSINIIGENRDTTIIHGSGNGDVVMIRSDWVNITGVTIIGGEDGISLSESSNNTITNNIVSSNDVYGISLYKSSNNIITSNNVLGNNFGVRLSTSSNNDIIHNNISYNDHGIWFMASSNNNIIENNVYLNVLEGVYIYPSSSNNIVSGNRILNNGNGIYIDSSSNNTISSNNITNNRYGIRIINSNNNILTNNNISLSDEYGIYMTSSLNSHIVGNDFVNDGIFIRGSQLSHFNTHNIPNDNIVNGKPLYYYKNCSGIEIDGNFVEIGQLILANCTDFEIRNLQMNNTEVGIEVAYCINLSIKGNNLSSNNWYGIFLVESSHNKITGNNFSNNDYGMGLESSSNNSIVGNNVTSNQVYGISLSSSSNNNDITNNNVSSNNNYGIRLAFSSINNVANNHVSIHRDGIIVSSSSQNNIRGNVVSSHDEIGIYLTTSPHNNITGNTVFNMSDGIRIRFSSENNIIANNNVSSCSDHGIYLWSSSNNLIRNNNISYNAEGVHIETQSSNNSIFHNNLIVNTNQAYDDTGDNFWNDTYPSGGNYWSDWTTPDENSGPNQDEPGSDGIVDNPRAMEGGSNQDNYPYTTKNGWLNPPDFGPVHNIDTDEYFDTIQAAIDDPDTLSGHTIEVSKGTYNENVVVNKIINLIGENKDKTIINASGLGDVINIVSDRVNISGFTITGCGSNSEDVGIELSNRYNCSITNNNGLWNDGYFLRLISSNNNLISGNNIIGNEGGIKLIQSSNNNILIDNNISLSSSTAQAGIFVTSSTDNEIIGNNVSSNYGMGFYIASSNNNISENIISSNDLDGISIRNEGNNNIKSNNISHNFNGIYVLSSPNNTITGNSVSNNSYGIAVWSSSDNKISHNNIISNGNQAIDDTNSNYWNDSYPSSGNYWSDWTSPDENSGPDQNEPGEDGIVDNPRAIEGGSNHDNYPYTTKNGWLNPPDFGPVHNIDTDEYFDTIQAAIDDSDTLDGHTLEVSSGTYYENIIVYKMLNLIGENIDTTIINGSGSGDVVTINEDWVNFTGFTITYSGVDTNDDGMEVNSNNTNISVNKFVNNRRSLYLSSSHSNTLTNNNFSSNSDTGLYLSSSNGNFIYGNTFSDNEYGISTWSSIGNNIIGNYITSNIESGINLQSSSEGNYVKGNILLNNEDGISLFLSNRNNIMGNNVSSNNVNGIVLASSNGNNITSNDAFFNGDTGIYLQNSHGNNVTDNTASFNNGDGFYLYSSNENNVSNNIASSNNNRGLQAFDSDNNNISGNIVTSNIEVNMYFWSSINNIITQNNISSGNYGFYLSLSSNNRIYHNNIFDNTNQAYDNGNNQWDDGYPSGGNYWSDYSGIDENSGPDQNEPNSDGIGDTPYDIDFDSQDSYPLMEPFVTDTIHPQIISGPTIISLNDTSATIVWETDEFSDSLVEYGETIGYGYEVFNSTFVISHSIVLTGLTPSTQYHYRVKSKDLYANEVMSGDYTFTTNPPAKPVHNLDKNTYYDTIQEAIDDSNSGNTIFVSNGIYYENVEVDKTITLIGEDRDNTIIDGGDNGDVITIYADFVNVTGFTVMNSSYLYAGISLVYSNYNNITGNIFYNNDNGLCLDTSNGNNISDNIALDNSDGIHLSYSSENRIIENDFTGNWYTIILHQSDWNVITHNIITDDPQGILIGSSDWNIISDNTLSLGRYGGGISLEFSIRNELTGNTMSETGIFINGINLEHWNTHNIDTSNTVDGKPVYYWKGQNGIILPDGAGQIILANCNNIIIENQELIHSFVGIELGFSSNISILGNNLSSNSDYGLYIFESHNNNITDNFISDNWHGIFLRKSNGNNINENIIFNNHLGIYLYHSIENNIFQNNISSNNNRGIAVKDYSSDNRIYHNIIQDNYIQAEDNGDGNYWDNGYPSGGNYWGNFTCVDEYCGPDQDQPGSDGIGDIPSVIDSDSQDDYPLLEPWEPDYIPPDINLIWPFNNSIIKPRTLINLSISDPHIYQVTYFLNGGPEQPLAPPYDINTTGWTDANYILEIHAIDTHSNANTKWFNITIDSTPPSITLNSPHNNSYVIWNVEINLTISDDNLEQVSYIKDNNSVQYLPFPYNIDTNSWEDGRHVIEVTAEDLAGNLQKKQFVFTKDTTPPVITLNSPENNTIITEDVEIYFTITDENLDEVYYRINNDTYLVLPFPYRIYTKGWQDGRYVIDIIAVDFASIGDIDQYVFTKDTAWPEITLNSPENNTLLMQASTLDFDISDVNLGSVIYSINQGTFQTLKEPYDIDTLGWDDGLYTIKIRAEDLAGHVSEKWFGFWIDTSFPSISSTSPVDGGSDMAVDGNITIEFSEPMDCDSVESAISTDPYIEYTCIWTDDNKTLAFNLLEPLEYDTLYQIGIKSKAKDLAGRELDKDYEFEFTTVEKPEDKDKEGFPIILLLALLMAIIVAVIIVALVMSKKKKTGAEVVEAQVEPITTTQPIQFICSNCNNLLQMNDTGVAQNVTCPFCSTFLTVQSRKAAPQLPVEKPQPQIQQQTIPIMCPKCSYKFSTMKSEGPTKVQCPNCGVSGTLK